MAETLSERIISRLASVAELYHRLILVVAPSGAGKTAALREVARQKGFPLVNVNLELSRRLLELTERQRALRLQQLLSEVIDQADGETVLLDNLEIVFDLSLRQDPLRLLQGLSRNRTVVAAWNGQVNEGYLTYAAPGHPEHRRYFARDLLIVTP